MLKTCAKQRLKALLTTPSSPGGVPFRGEPMSDFDLRAVFAKMCADAPAGEADGTPYEATLGLAVERLVGRTRDSREGLPMRPLHALGSPADCPFMVSVMTLPFEPMVHSLR